MLLSYRKALIDGKFVDIDKVITILNKLPVKDDPNIVEFIAYLRTQENIEFKENKNDYVHVQLKRYSSGVCINMQNGSLTIRKKMMSEIV